MDYLSWRWTAHGLTARGLTARGDGLLVEMDCRELAAVGKGRGISGRVKVLTCFKRAEGHLGKEMIFF